MSRRTCILIAVLACYFVNKGSCRKEGVSLWKKFAYELFSHPDGPLCRAMVYELQKSSGSLRPGQLYVGKLLAKYTTHEDNKHKRMAIKNVKYYQFQRAGEDMTAAKCVIKSFNVDQNYKASGGKPKCDKPKSLFNMHHPTIEEPDFKGDMYMWIEGLMYYMNIHKNDAFIWISSLVYESRLGFYLAETNFTMHYELVEMNYREKVDLTKAKRSECTVKIYTRFEPGDPKLLQKPKCKKAKRFL